MIIEQASDLLLGRAESSSILCDDRHRLSYAALKEAVDHLSIFFLSIKKEEAYCLGIALKNEIPHVAILLALLKTGQNFYLIPPNSDPKKIPDFCDKILAFKDSEKWEVDRLSQWIELNPNPSFTNKCSNIAPRKGAIFLSTSGTSGNPKFVYFQSWKLIENARNVAKRFYLASHHHVLVPVPIYHMYGLGVGLLPSILSGSSICLISNNNIVKLLDKSRQFKPHVTLLTPTTCNMLLMLDKDIHRSHMYITAGAKINKHSHLKFETRFGQLINLYGCTELGAIATSGLAYSQAERLAGLVSPLPSVRMQVKTPDKGEIIAKHPAGFEYYIDKKGRKMPTDTLDADEYKTRDLGEEISPNKFKILGRIDNCVNRNGFLVSLQEVESLMEEVLEETQQIVVIEQQGQNVMGSQLLAICELKEGKSLDTHKAKKRCQTKMKRFLIPDSFIFLPKIPRLNNGKPNRNTLKETYRTINT